MHFADVVHTTSLRGLRDLHIHNRCHISCLQRGEKQATLSFGAKRSRLRSYTLHTGKLEADQRDSHPVCAGATHGSGPLNVLMRSTRLETVPYFQPA